MGRRVCQPSGDRGARQATVRGRRPRPRPAWKARSSRRHARINRRGCGTGGQCIGQGRALGCMPTAAEMKGFRFGQACSARRLARHTSRCRVLGTSTSSRMASMTARRVRDEERGGLEEEESSGRRQHGGGAGRGRSGAPASATPATLLADYSDAHRGVARALSCPGR